MQIYAFVLFIVDAFLAMHRFHIFRIPKNINRITYSLLDENDTDAHTHTQRCGSSSADTITRKWQKRRIEG